MNKDYNRFVMGLLSEPSTNVETLIARIREIEASGMNPAMLLCAALGIAGEGAEVGDLAKKIFFQGKEVDRLKLIKELGDIRFYTEVLYKALNVTDEEVTDVNMEKLMSRYPDGFKVEHSENRKAGDV